MSLFNQINHGQGWSLFLKPANGEFWGPYIYHATSSYGTTQSILLWQGTVLYATCPNTGTGSFATGFAYRTVSEPAVFDEEHTAIYSRKNEDSREVVAREECQHRLAEWQLSWRSEPRGTWTARFIVNLDPWLYRKYGDIGYFLTQLLNGHGLFQSLRHKIGKARSPDYVICNGEEDGVKVDNYTL